MSPHQKLYWVSLKAARGLVLCFVTRALWSDEAKLILSPIQTIKVAVSLSTPEQKQDTEIQPNFIACISNVPYNKIRTHDLTHEEELRVKKAAQIIRESRIRLIDMPDFTITKLEKKIKECAIGNMACYGKG